MAFILFPVFVLLMVIVVILSYNRLTGRKKKLDILSKEILVLHKRDFELIKSSMNNIHKIFPEQSNLSEKLHQELANAETNPARNLSTSTQYYRLIKSSQEELFLAIEKLSAKSHQADFIEFKNKEKVILSELGKDIEAYNIDVAQFNKALNTFPNNLLAGMAGLVPYEFCEP